MTSHLSGKGVSIKKWRG